MVYRTITRCTRVHKVALRLVVRRISSATRVLANQLSSCSSVVGMITKHITEVTTRFNPFKKPSKTCRVFLAYLPANARTTMKINTTVLPRDSPEPSFLKLKFSMW